jgi:cobalamin biosynthesis protein CobD/CbiB
LREHADGLVVSLQAREKESTKWKGKLDAANERMRAEAQRFENDRAALAQQVVRLTARLEQEQLTRAMAEGALESARKDRGSAARPAVVAVAAQEQPAPQAD